MLRGLEEIRSANRDVDTFQESKNPRGDQLNWRTSPNNPVHHRGMCGSLKRKKRPAARPMKAPKKKK